MNILISRISWLYTLILLLMPQLVLCKTVTIKVLDSNNQLVANTVITVKPAQTNMLSATTPSPTYHQMEQVNRSFKPNILLIQQGDFVSFPNRDPIKHHLYSFSKPKVFEIQLYKADTPNPIQFKKAGVVSLGCNIHDWMVGYIYVSDAPYNAITNTEGTASFDLIDNIYHVKVWHPLMDSSDSILIHTLTVPNQSYLNIKLKNSIKNRQPEQSSGQLWDDY